MRPRSATGGGCDGDRGDLDGAARRGDVRVDLRAGDDAAKAAGLQDHAAGPGDGGWRIIEVLESREGMDGFVRDALGPVVAGLSGGQAPPMSPQTFKVHAID